jgi:riboflavin synthase
MFTGLVQYLATVSSVEDLPPGKRLVIRAAEITDAQVGESIALNGCCLTVIQIDPDHHTLAFDAGAETLARTNLYKLALGSRVNLERSLRAGDRLGGHFVTGHVDAVGVLDQRNDDQQWSTLWFRVPEQLTRQMVSKGSVTVDGVSLTLVDVEADRFSVALIPHTLAVTTLGNLRVGDLVNLETDLLAKYVQKAAITISDFPESRT